MALRQVCNVYFGCLQSKASLFVPVKDLEWNIFSQRSISSTALAFGKYTDAYVDPIPDPECYARHLPSKSDDIAHKSVKAANTDQTYSAFYDGELIKFEKLIMKRGRSIISKKIVRGALEYIKSVQVKKYHRASEEEKQNIETCPLKIFHQALENAKPLLTVRMVKKGGQSFPVPDLVPEDKHLFLIAKTMRLHIMLGHPNTEGELRLGKELLAAYHNEGAAVKAKLELHKKANANRVYANLI